MVARLRWAGAHNNSPPINSQCTSHRIAVSIMVHFCAVLMCPIFDLDNKSINWCRCGEEISDPRECVIYRPAHGGKYCIGQRRRYRSCNIQVNCNSSPFLPRDAVHKRGLCRRAVSVRLSVCILSKRINIILKLFSPSGSLTILVFSCNTLRYGNIPTGTPPPLHYTTSSQHARPSGVLRRRFDGLECAAWRPPRPVAQCRQFQKDGKDASVSECT